jgi:hypothetical protein
MRYLLVCSSLLEKAVQGHIVSSHVSLIVNNSSMPTVTSGCSLESVSFYVQLDFDCSSELCFSVLFMNFRKEVLILTKQGIVL